MHARAEVCLPFVTEQQVYLTGFLSRCMQYWLKNLSLCSVQTLSQQCMTKPPCTPTIFLLQQSWAIITLLMICVYAYKWRKWRCKWNHSSSVTAWFELPHETSKLWKSDGLVYCKKKWVVLTHFGYVDKFIPFSTSLDNFISKAVSHNIYYCSGK